MNSDLISRQATIDAFNAFADQVNQDTDIHEAIELVLNLPPVTPAEKVGQWIKIDDCSNSGYYCSECRKRVVKEGWSDTVKIIKYCPNCGAKMQGVKE